MLTVLLLLTSQARAEPAVWVVRGPHATVYLLGSVHLLRPGTEWLGPVVRRVFDEADECWFEATIPDDPSSLSAYYARAAFDFGLPLSSLLTPEQNAKLTEVARTLGVTMNLDTMRPWFAGTLLALQVMTQAGYDPSRGADLVLMRMAEEAGKHIEGIETAEGQLHLMAELPQHLAASMLVSILDDAASASQTIDRFVERWQAGSTDPVAEDLRTTPEIRKLILTDRNRNFAHAVAQLLLGDKTVLVTVGAAHLSGPGNVREMLEQEGLIVERVTD